VAWLTGSVVPAAPIAAMSQPIASHALTDSGYYISRVAGRHHLVVDGGDHGYLNGGHAHADALSLTLSVRDRPLLIDPGTACYTIDTHLRDRFRSTLAHNTVQLDESPQSISAGPFQWERVARAVAHRWRSAAGFDLFDGSHDGYAPLLHRRRVLIIHGELVVVADTVLGDGVHKAEVHWHLSDCWTPRIDGHRIQLAAAGERVQLIVPHGQVETFRADSATGLGWYSPAYGVIRPTATLRVTHTAPAPFTLASVFDLNSSNPAEQAEWLPVWAKAGIVGQSCALRIARRESTDVVLFAEPADPSASGRWRVGEFETDARMLYHRIDRSGNVTGLALVDGSFVRAAGRRAFALALGRPTPALMIDESTIGTYTPCAALPAL
jgi:Heparinase II/III-like protein